MGDLFGAHLYVDVCEVQFDFFNLYLALFNSC